MIFYPESWGSEIGAALIAVSLVVVALWVVRRYRRRW